MGAGERVESSREVRGLVRVGGKDPKEAYWKEVLGTRDENTKERYQEVYKEKKKRLKGVYIRSSRR